MTDAEARKQGEQTGLDTLVVPALNGVHLTWGLTAPCRSQPRLKLKEIDGGPHKRRSMWLNSMQREEPYLDLTCGCTARESGLPSRVPHRCCMAVVSSCREVFG